MPRVDLTLETGIERTARVAQLEGIFDVPSAEKTRVEFHFEAPYEERPWQVGLIVGPSGAGKSSVARHLFGDAIVSGYDWHPTRSIVDCFGDLGIRETTAALSSVGFSSPPNWLRPFRVLSNGEQFRATMARALVDSRPLIVVDEFTSVVDRTVAQVGSHAVSKSIRSRPGKQFVAVTCHYDIAEWLQPDWVLEPHLGQFAWRSLQRRPRIDVEVVRCDHSAWRWFAPHHYMSADLHKGARIFCALVRGEPVALVAVMHFPHVDGAHWRLSRGVVLPDYQGLGAMMHLVDFVGATVRTTGGTLTCTMSHPATIHMHAKSPKWDMIRSPSMRSARGANASKGVGIAVHSRRTASFRYVGPALAPEIREVGLRLWA